MTEKLVTGVNLAVRATTARVVRTLNAEGVDTIVLKGPVLQRWLHGRENHASTDADVLVPPNQFAAAESTLRRLGFESRVLEGIAHDRPWNAHVWIDPSGGIAVDLHHGLVGANAPDEIVWHVLRSSAEEATVGGASVRILGPPARALHVAMHAAQHGVRYKRTLEDLAAALERVPETTWKEAAEVAEAIGASAAFAAGLELLPNGRELREAMHVPLPANVRAVLQATSPPPTAGGFEWLFSTSGRRRQLVLVARKLFPPAEWLRNWTPLARRGWLGLVAAYVWRPLWLLRHAGPGFFAWRRARRRIR